MSDDLTYVSQELRVAVGRVARRLRRISTEGDAEGAVKFTELLVLTRLSHEGALSPSDIARHEKVTSQAIAAVVRDLETRGLVTRDAHSTDGRRTVIALTRAGRAALASHDQAAAHTMVEVLDERFSSGEIRRLTSAIPLLNRLADLI
nr:MarR family transcriptional regulator [Streptomyces sp. NBC_00830]